MVLNALDEAQKERTLCHQVDRNRNLRHVILTVCNTCGKIHYVQDIQKNHKFLALACLEATGSRRRCRLSLPTPPQGPARSTQASPAPSNSRTCWSQSVPVVVRRRSYAPPRHGLPRTKSTRWRNLGPSDTRYLNADLPW